MVDYHGITSYSRGVNGYRAPELLQKESRYSTRSDIWSLGCIAYEIVTRRKAFDTDFDVFAFSQKKASTTIVPPPGHLGKGSDAWEGIIAAMLQVSDVERPSASYLRTEFRSQWHIIEIDNEKYVFPFYVLITSLQVYLDSNCSELMAKINAERYPINDWERDWSTGSDPTLSCQNRLGSGGSGRVFKVTN